MRSQDADDWRISGQEKYLTGATFSFRAYTPPRDDWDHEHCAFCWSKFCTDKQANCSQEGYVTADGKFWVCRECYADFRERFQFVTQKQT
jgi:hypothetical protein